MNFKTNDLITESPIQRQKGFKDENIIISSDKKEDYLFS